MKSKICIAFFVLVASSFASGQRRSTASAAAGGARTLTGLTGANAIVWIDEIRRGTADSAGKLEMLRLSSGGDALRVRANGCKGATMPIGAAQRGEIKVHLLRATDESELTFQQAETAR